MPRILFFDDRKEEQTLTLTALRERFDGIDVDFTEDCDEMGALAFLPSFSSKLPELVILDPQALGGKGWEMLRKIKQLHGSDVRVIVHSTSENLSDVARAYVLGADGYVLKFPFRPESNHALFHNCERWLSSISQPLVR